MQELKLILDKPVTIGSNTFNEVVINERQAFLASLDFPFASMVEPKNQTARPFLDFMVAASSLDRKIFEEQGTFWIIGQSGVILDFLATTQGFNQESPAPELLQ